jgi:hypothetical protein
MTQYGSTPDAAAFKNRHSKLTEPISPSPVGERIFLPNGAIVERPNPLIIELLQTADPRVHYFSTNIVSFLIDVAPKKLHYIAVSQKIGYQVKKDFPDEEVYVRSSVAPLIDQSTFPYWNRSWELGSIPEFPLNSVRDILSSGSDDGGESVVIGDIDSSGIMNAHSIEWLSMHYTLINQKHQGEKIDQLFPILLVYKRSAFAENIDFGWNKLIGKPQERIAAIYVTDRVKVPDVRKT